MASGFKLRINMEDFVYLYDEHKEASCAAATLSLELAFVLDRQSK